MPEIRIGRRVIGSGAPCFIVAEVGINHNGDVALAKRCIDAAADCGADGVKFQNYRTEDFLSDRSLTYTHVSQGREVTESQFDMFKRCEISAATLAGLKAHCDARGVVFHSTPTSEQGIADLVAIGTPVLKNGSDYLGHLPLIAAMGRTGLPTVLSTGMATYGEIEAAVQAFRGTGNEQILLLHCTSAYPASPKEVNLSRLEALAKAFTCPVGFSDHTQGTTAAIGAAILGACWIEKHFTLDKSLPGPDHHFSADPAEFSALVRGVREAEQMRGSPAIEPVEGEQAGRINFRLSCVAATDLPKGHVLAKDDIAFRRPGKGIPPANAGRLIGRVLRHAVQRGHAFAEVDLDDQLQRSHV